MFQVAKELSHIFCPCAFDHRRVSVVVVELKYSSTSLLLNAVYESHVYFESASRKTKNNIYIGYATTKLSSMVETAWTEDMGRFLYHLDSDTRKITRKLKELPLKIINKKCSFVFNKLALIYDQHHVMPLARISLTLSRHFSLSFIASGRSSGLHPRILTKLLNICSSWSFCFCLAICGGP